MSAAPGVAPSATAAGLYNQAIALPRATPQRTSLLHKALQLDPSLGAAYLSLGADARQEASPLRALPFLQAAVERLPAYAPAVHAYGEALLAARRPADALPHLKAAISAVPAHSPYEYQHGMALLASYRVREASTSLERAATLSPALGVHTTRNDAGLGAAELEALAAQS